LGLALWLAECLRWEGALAGFALIAAGTPALAIPIVGIVIGVSLIIFGSLMIYQTQKGQRRPPSLVGRTVEISHQLPDQKKIEPVMKPNRVSVPSSIWQQKAMAMAAIAGRYGLIKLGSCYYFMHKVVFADLSSFDAEIISRIFVKELHKIELI